MHNHLFANRLGRWLAATAFGLLAVPAAHAQLAGPKAIPGDYPTVAAAITALNTQGVGAGGVTFNITAGYTETFASPTAGAITATGTAANPIVFQKSGSGANPILSAGVGTGTQDAVISLAGTDYATFTGIDVAESSANTTTATQMEFGYALFRASATDGCQNVSISNATITLNKSNTATIGIWGANSLATATTAVAATSAAGANSSIKLNGNTVANAFLGIYLAGNTSTAANADTGNEIGTTAGNTLTGLGGSNTSVYGVRAEYQQNLKVENNTIAIPAGNTSSTVYGIGLGTGTATGIIGTVLLNNNTISLTSATTSTIIGILQGGSSGVTTSTITNNKVQNSTLTGASGSVFYIQDATTSAATSVTMTGNQVMGNTAATTGTVYGLYKTASGTTLTVTGNTISNNTKSGAGVLAGFFANITITNLTVSNNTISGNQITAASGSFFGVNLGSSASNSVLVMNGNTITNNTISNTSGSTASVSYGLYSFGAVSTSETETGNTITGQSISGASTASATLYGLYIWNSATPKTVAQNTIGNLTLGAASTAVTGTTAGIFFANTAGSTVALSQNKLYGLSAYGTAGVVYGMYLLGATTPTISNNLIGNLVAPAATAAQAVTGLYIAGGTTVNVYYNTIYLAGTSTGTGFSSSGIYASTTPTLTLANNIVVNNSVATGTGIAAAYRRSGTTLTTYATASNNNLFYAGTPGTTQAIFTDGTNTYATLAAYKTALANRDQTSVTELPPFVSTNGTDATFLHISTTTPTQVESGGTPISGITTDFDGDTRSTTTPDLGADEGTFQALDLTGPAIAFTALTNTSSTANRTLVVTISDLNGISTTTAPRLFYRKGTSGTFVSALATSVSGSTYTFTFDYAALGGVAVTDVIQYYVAAQDGPGNVSTSPLGGTYTTTPASVYQYTVLSALSGVYYVGTSTSPDPTRTYATLTAAANAYSTSGMSGAVTFLLLDNAYSTATGETFPVVFFNNPDASATNTLLIKPNTGATPVITAAGSVLALASTRYVTIDGSNTVGGTTRNLTLSNTVLTASTYGLGLLTQTGIAQSNLFTTVRNVNVTGGGVTVNATIGIVLGGADNDNVTLQNNSILGVTTGIQAFGTTNTSVGGLDNLVITGNVVGPATATTGSNINEYGIVVASAISPVVSANEVQNILNPTATFSATIAGILLQDVKTAVVSRNSLHNLVYNGTSTTKVYGITTQVSTSTFNTAANASANRFDNNVVYALNSTATSTAWNTSGINNNGGYGDQYYFNTVYLSGQLSNGTAGSAAFSNGNGNLTTAAANIDVRNNIFSIIGGTGVATTPLYAHYTTLANYTGSTVDYNDLYVTAGATGVARIGRINSADATTLADWRTATAQEAHSLSVDPQFVQTTAAPYDLTPANVGLNNAGTPISAVTVDFRNTTRGALPDLGAYEFTPLSFDLAPAALLAPATTSTCYSATEPVSVSIRNAGTGALDFSVTPATVTVVVTLPGATTQSFTATLNTGTLASGATQTVSLPGTLDMTTVGIYSFAVTATVTGDGNTTNDVLTPAPTRTVNAPIVGALAASSANVCISGTVNLTLAGAANGSIQYQSSTDNVTFTDIVGATSATYATPVLTATTYYRAQVRCNTGTATSNVSTITVSNPTVATTNTPLSICAGSTATLTATASTGANVRFFGAATGGTALATTTPGSYTTPALTTNTTYYAEAYTPNGGSENVGKAVTTNLGSAGYTLDAGLVFNVTAATQIQSVTVFPSSTTAGTLTVALVNSAGTTISTVGPLAIPAGSISTAVPVVLPLNLNVPVGTGYRLVAVGTHPELHRESTSVAFPYTSPSGNVTITGGYISGASTTYYFFYNWQVSGDCVSTVARTPIQVNVTPAPTAAFPAATASACGTSAYQLAGTVGGSATTGTYTTSGTGTFSPNATTLNATYTPSAADVAAGTVTITLTSNATSPCTGAIATLALSISPAPVATFSYPAATTYCAGSTSTVTPTLGTGATAGTFSATTGLSIDPISGVIILSNSTAGTYTVTNTIAASGACGAATATATVTITPATSAAFSYGSGTTTPTFCVSGTTNPTITLGTGATAGAFSSTTGLTINATTGAITLSTSTPGTYTVTNTVAGNCGSTATAQVTITAAPVATFSYGAPATFCVSGTTAPAVVLGTGATAGTFSSTTGLTINATTGAITLSSSTPGTYVVTNSIAAASGCAAATATTSVTITAAPVAAFSYATTSACAGSATLLTPTLGTGATAGTYSSTTGLTINATTGAVNPATSTAGTYTVTNTVAASGGCTAVTSTATVTINALPATPTVTVSYPTRSTALLTSSVAPAGTTYQWYLGGVAIAGATAQTYTANGTTAPGAYSVCVISTATGCRSCSNSTAVTATQNAITGASLRLYPNPTPNGQVTLELTGFRSATQLTVLDALGRVVTSQQLPANAGTATRTLDLSGVATGVYLLRLSNADGVETHRLVRE